MENALVKIGNVVLDYSKYCGKDLYSDGDIEEVLLKAVVSGSEENLLRTSNNWPVLYHLSDIRENVVEWVQFSENDEVLEIGSGCGAITGLLSRKAGKVTCVELSETRSLINANRHKNSNNIEIKIGNFQDVEPDLGQYDYITLIGVLEYAMLYIQGDNSYVELLKIAKKHLKDDGKLIVAIENKMGLKYLNGACEDHTGKMYSGVNDYIEDDGIRTFSSNELGEILEEAGFENYRFYCATPDYKLPDIISAYDFDLKPGSVRTYRKVYSKARFYNFLEDVVSDQLCRDKMFSYMANSYVVITGDESSDVLLAKYCRERRKQYRIATNIVGTASGNKVVKYSLTKEAEAHILSLKKKEDMYRSEIPAVNCVKGSIVDKKYVSDYVDGVALDEILYKYRNDVDRFVAVSREYADEYLTPKNGTHSFAMSDEFRKVFGDVACEDEMCTQVSNVDALFSNIKIDDNGKAWMFDFEWVFNFDIPYKYAIWRSYRDVYYKYLAYLKDKISEYDFCKSYGFSDKELKRYQMMEKHFIEYVFGTDKCEQYTTRYVKTVITQNARMI